MSTPPQNKSSIKLPLRVMIIAPFAVLIVLAGGLVGYLSFRNGQQAVNDVAHQLRGELTARIEGHLLAWLDTPHQINQVNANAIRQGLLDPNDPNALEHHFWQQIQIFDSVTSIYFGNTAGGLVDAGREGAAGSLYVIVTDRFVSGPFRKYATDAQGNRAELLATVSNFDSRTRPWYTGAVGKSDATWSEAYILFAGQDMAIAASRPVYDKRQNLLGVVSVDLFLSHFNSFLQSLKIGKTGKAFIMERSGLMVASSTAEKPFTEPEEGKPRRRVYASENMNPIIRYTAEALTKRFGDYRHITGVEHLEFKIKGQRQFLQVLPVKNEDGLDWLIVVVIPEADFMTQINANNRNTIFLIVVTLALALIVGIIAAQGIIRPIIRLNASAQILAQGKWTKPVIDDGWMGEISELTQSFNKMVGQLQQMLESLTTEISDRKRTEDALRESDQKFRELFDSITDLIYTQDMEGRFLTVNPAMHSLFGYDIDEFIGRTGADFMKPELRPLYFSEYLEGIKKQGHFEGISPYFKKDGGRIYIEFRSKLVQSEHGAPYISGIGRNVTERVLAEKERKRSEKERVRLQTQLIQAQKMESVGRLAGGVAHDFNNMLGVILGRTEMMLMGMNPEDPHYANLEEIQKAAKRSADLTRQLLAFARKQTISPKVLDLNDTVEGMLKMLRRLIGEDIDLVWRPNAHLWPVKMDAAQVDQILANLCVNARDAISGTGNVTIGTENSILDEIFCAAHTGFQPGQYAMLSVSDDGCGMNQETQSHLFEPFFTTKEVGKGTGLGLATVYGIVKQNDGFIHVYSEPGQGTTFKIYIPRHEGGAVMEMAADSIEVTKGHGETLLLVEDDSGILAMGKAMLERLGYTVLTSGDPSQALTLVKAHAGRIHLLMTDVVMPQISGKDLAEQIKMLKPEIKILFMSGYTADIISNHGILERDVHFIQKPFSIKDLAAKVRQVLE